MLKIAKKKLGWILTDEICFAKIYIGEDEKQEHQEDSHEFSNLIPGVESRDPTPAGNRSYPQNRLALPTMP